jgi:hypothetical protein
MEDTFPGKLPEDGAGSEKAINLMGFPSSEIFKIRQEPLGGKMAGEL